MSFSQETKNELARLIPENDCCLVSELSAIVFYGGGGPNISGGFDVSVGSAAVARKAYLMLKRIANLNILVRVRNKVGFQQGHTYVVSIQPQPGLSQLLSRLPPDEKTLDNQVRENKQCCLEAFVRGVFLACGSITNPERNYHLEMVCQSRGLAEILRAAAAQLEVDTKLSHRKNIYLVYLKEGEQIVQLLSLMGAHHALLSLENVRVWKDLRNQVNRRVNCETANMDKTVKAAMKQLDSIKLLEATIGLSSLPESLRGVAQLRLAHPYASLKELGSMLDPPISKSGVNHRMRRLEKLAEDIQGTKGHRASR